ncbi:hypothetical protein FA160_02610 [Pseudomonas aeruginosa]|nr:hypothetical protein [Pseudomonas aeruginosa]
MDHLLSGLATRLGQGPFVADRTGSYHLRIDGLGDVYKRQGLDGLDPERLERALAAQVGLLEALAPELEPLPCGLPPQAPVWRP